MKTHTNWDTTRPTPEIISVFEDVTDDAREFPDTYSGQAWRAAYRLWLAVRYLPAADQRAAMKDGYSYDPSWRWSGEDGCEDLGLSGFMAGWAINAVRQMLYLNAIPNGAVVTIGAESPPLPSTAPAGDMMHEIIGG